MWRGGRDEKGAVAARTTVKASGVTPAWRGMGETEKSELKEKTGAKTRETKVQTLPQATIVVGGARQKAKTTTK